MSAPTVDDVRVDTHIWPVMEELAACLCNEIVNAGLPDTCFCGILPGSQIAADYVTPKAGMAWVRLGSGWPYTNFPSFDQRGSSCASPLAFQIEVGVLYCSPVFRDSRGNPPTVSAQADAARIQVAAMAAMHRAIACCLGGAPKGIAMGQYTPIGPEGDVVGGMWEVIVDGRYIGG